MTYNVFGGTLSLSQSISQSSGSSSSLYQGREPSSVTEHFQLLDWQSGTQSLSPSGQPTTFSASNVIS